MGQPGQVVVVPPMRPSADLLIVIPARNEAERIPVVLEGIAMNLPLAEVLVVEDGSTDDTVAIARSSGARVVSLPYSLGYGGAIRVGFQYARSKGYPYVITMDADGQHDPRDLPALSAALKNRTGDFIIGSRFLGRATYRIPLTRKLGMALFSAVTSMVVKKRVSDTTSGYLGVGPRALPVVAANCATDFPNAELICLVSRSGLTVAEIPVTIRERTDGKSLFTFWKAFYYPFKLLLAVSMVLLREKSKV